MSNIGSIGGHIAPSDEYTGITEKLAALERRFVARAPARAAVA